MKLAAKYDIEAPVDYVFGEMTDFDAWERVAQRRGAEVERLDNLDRTGIGMAWQVGFTFRAKPRQARLSVTGFTPGTQLVVAAISGMVDADLTFDLVELSPKRTRISVHLQAKPKKLAARIYFQTLKLARKKLEAGFAHRVAEFAVEFEDRYRATKARKA